MFLVLAPLLFIWFSFALFSFIIRSLAYGARQVEDFWTEHLTEHQEDDKLFLDKTEMTDERRRLTRERPEAVARDTRLTGIWDQALKFHDEPDLPELRKYRTAVLRQTHALAELYERFRELLGRKLRPDELTYRRFAASGAQSSELIAAELEEVLHRLEHLSSIESTLRPTEDETRSRGSLIHQIRRDELSKVEALLTRTREAIVQLARVNLAISEMKAPTAAKRGNINQAVDQLKELTQRARQFPPQDQADVSHPR